MMKKRTLSLFIDYISITFIVLLPVIICRSFGNTEIYIINMEIPCVYILFLFKDMFFQNTSIGKKIMGLEVRTTTNNIPSLFNTIFRNITIIIWPLECLLILMGKERIGDRISKTKVVEIQK